jgi:hypothetical protein
MTHPLVFKAQLLEACTKNLWSAPRGARTFALTAALGVVGCQAERATLERASAALAG